jgi:hypothetical protein
LLERQIDSTPIVTKDPTEIATPTSAEPILPTRATYRASIYTPDGEFSTTATLAEDGTVQVGTTGAPGDLDDRLKNIAKLVARDAPKRRDDGLAVWPSRIMRWRK